MNAYKCDICGGFYVEQKSNVINKKKVRLGTNTDFCHICPKCTDAIQTVIDTRLGINGKENELK